MSKCDKDCRFRKSCCQEDFLCLLAAYFEDKLNGFCPKEIHIEQIRRNCKHYIPLEENTEGKRLCRVTFYEYGRYCECWVETLDDLLLDADFTLE